MLVIHQWLLVLLKCLIKWYCCLILKNNCEINPEINEKLTTLPEVTKDIKEQRNDVKVFVAEDSPMLRDLLVQTL